MFIVPQEEKKTGGNCSSFKTSTMYNEAFIETKVHCLKNGKFNFVAYVKAVCSCMLHTQHAYEAYVSPLDSQYIQSPEFNFFYFILPTLSSPKSKMTASLQKTYQKSQEVKIGNLFFLDKTKPNETVS